jgi:hypothetical protein
VFACHNTCDVMFCGVTYTTVGKGRGIAARGRIVGQVLGAAATTIYVNLLLTGFASGENCHRPRNELSCILQDSRVCPYFLLLALLTCQLQRSELAARILLNYGIGIAMQATFYVEEGSEKGSVHV